MNGKLAIAVAALLVALFGHRVAAQTKTAFMQCVDRQIPALDDFMSPADVIAGAVAEKCREWIADEAGFRIEEVLARLKRRIVPLVLEYRGDVRLTDQIIREELLRVCGETRTGFCAELDKGVPR